jgi:type I restriction enzyme M protein
MASDIWSVADKLRGHYMRHEYGEVILPLTVLRRLDAVMAPTRQAVWDRDATLTKQGIQNKDRPLRLAAGLPFYNTSRQDFSTIASDAAFAAKNLRDYISGFSENVRKIVERFDLDNHITRMA